MKFLHLKINNAFVLDKCELALDNQGLVLVTGHSEDDGGSNGSGKSSLCSRSICWVLFGRSPDGDRGDDIVNRNSDRDFASVEIEFEEGEDLFKVIRTRNPARLAFLISENDYWLDISLRLENETQDLIEKTIGRNFTSFVQTDFFGQGKSAIPFPSLSPRDQRGILENILPMHVLEGWKDEAAGKKKEIDTEIAKISGALQADGIVLQSNSSALTSLIKQDRLWELKQVETIDRLSASLESLDVQVIEFETKKANLENSIGVIKDTTQLAVESASNDFLIKENSELLAHCSITLSDQAKELVVLMSKQTMIETSICPECKQILPLGTEDKMLDETQDRIEQIKGHKVRYEKIIADSKVALEELKLKKSNLYTNIDLHEQNNTQIEKTKAELEILLSLGPPERLSLVIELNAAKKAPSPLAVSIAVHTNKVAELNNTIEENKNRLTWVQKDRAAVSVWESAFKHTFKLMLFKRACDFLNSKTEEHLNKLNNSQLHVEFATLKVLKSKDTKEELNLTCWSDTGGKSFFALSSGEKQMISFAISLSLSDLASIQVKSKCNLMVLDEPFVCLDEVNSENIVNYITTELSRPSIFLISNDDSLKALIPKRINLVKKHGISQIQQQ